MERARSEGISLPSMGAREWELPAAWLNVWECCAWVVAVPWFGARAWIGWWALPGGLEGCVSSMGDPALWGSLFRWLQHCETQHRSVDKVEAFQVYMLYCSTHRGQGSHSFIHFPTTKSLYINYMESTSFGQKRYIFLILVLCLCGDPYRFQQFFSLHRILKLQAW